LILNSGITLHIFNEILCLINFRVAQPGDFVWAGDSKVAVLRYGEANIEMTYYQKTNILYLCEVVFCPDLICNLVLLLELHPQPAKPNPNPTQPTFGAGWVLNLEPAGWGGF
jgi:hypothetical protein